MEICDRLPETAKVLDKVTLVRTVHHTMKNHNSAGYYSLTGQAPPTDDQRLRDTRDLYPAYGSVVDRFAPAERGTPTFVSYPHVIADGSMGRSGDMAKAIALGADAVVVGSALARATDAPV